MKYSSPLLMISSFVLACNFDEYTCLDGTCIQMDDVCDGISDCDDKSDELNCQSIRFDATYTKNQPPLSLEDKHNKNKLSVHIDMTILSVFELNEIQSWMKLQLQLDVKWIDPRLKFANLKKGKKNKKEMVVTNPHDEYHPVRCQYC